MDVVGTCWRGRSWPIEDVGAVVRCLLRGLQYAQGANACQPHAAVETGARQGTFRGRAILLVAAPRFAAGTCQTGKHRLP